MEDKVFIVNPYSLEKILKESLEKAFKEVEELKDYNWDFISEHITIDSNE